MPKFDGILVRKNGEVRMSFQDFKDMKPESVYKHLVERGK